MASKKAVEGSLSADRISIGAIKEGVINGTISHEKARVLNSLMRTDAYLTNSIVRNSKITGVPLSQGNLDWAA